MVAIESPTDFGVLRGLQALGLRALEISMLPRTGMSLEALELVLDTRRVKAVLAVPTLSNPRGTIMPTASKKRLAELLDRRQVSLIEDVICNDLAPSEGARRAVKSFDRSGNVMICGSFGKTFAPGLRGIGWGEGGRRAVKVGGLKRAFSGGGSEAVEWAVAELLEHGGYEQSLRQRRLIFAAKRADMRQLIGATFPAGTRVTDHGAGDVLWIELPRSVDAIELDRRCLGRRIVVVPGPVFTTTDRYRNGLRLNAEGTCNARTKQALRTVGAIAARMAADATAAAPQ